MGCVLTVIHRPSWVARGWTASRTQETDMGQARGLLAGTMQRLTAFSQTAHGKQLMYLTGFVLFVFLVIYYLIR